MMGDCFLKASAEVREHLRKALEATKSEDPHKFGTELRRGTNFRVSQDITAITKGNLPKLPFSAEGKGAGKLRVLGSTKEAIDWWLHLGKGLGLDLSKQEDLITRVIGFGVPPSLTRKKALDEMLITPKIPSVEDINRFIALFPPQYQGSVSELLVGYYTNLTNWIHFQMDKIYLRNQEMGNAFAQFKAGLSRLFEEIGEAVPAHPLDNFAQVERETTDALMQIMKNSEGGTKLTDEQRDEAFQQVVRILQVLDPILLDPTSDTRIQKNLRMGLYMSFGRENLNLEDLFGMLSLQKTVDEVKGEKTKEAFDRILSALYPDVEKPPIQDEFALLSPTTPMEETAKVRKRVQREKRTRAKAKTQEQMELPLEETPSQPKSPEEVPTSAAPEAEVKTQPPQPKDMFPMREDLTPEEGERAFAEGIMRAAYSPEEINEAIEHLRKRGVDIPEGASKEQAQEAIKKHFDEGKRLQPPVAGKTVPKPIIRHGDGIRPPVEEPPTPPPTQPSRLALPEPSPEPQLGMSPFEKEVAEALGSWMVDEVAQGQQMADYMGDTLFRASHRNITVREAEKQANRLIQPYQESVSREVFTQRIKDHPAFVVQEGEEGVRVSFNEDWLKAEEERLQKENPFMLLMNDRTRRAYVAWRTLFDVLSNGEPMMMETFDSVMASRMMMNPQMEHLEETVHLIAAYFGENELIDLLLKADPEMLNRVEDWLTQSLQYTLYFDLIEQVLAQNKVLFLGRGDNEWISWDDWEDMSREAKIAFIEELKANEALQDAFLENFGFVEEGRRLLKEMLQDGKIRQEVENYAYIRNPAILEKVLRLADRMGVDPMTLTTMGKILYEHAVQLTKLLDGVGLKWDSIPVLTPKGLGMDAIRAMMEQLRDVYIAKGKRGEDVYNLLEDLLTREGETNLIGVEAYKALMYGVSDHLKEAFGEAWTLAVNYVFVADRLFHRGLMMNLAEVVIPLFSQLSRIRQTVDGEGNTIYYRLMPEIFSLTATEANSVAFGALLEKTFGQPKESFFDAIAPFMPEEWQALYYAYKRSGEGGHFDIYVPKIVADLLEMDEFAIRHPLQVANDVFKSLLVVYNPAAQLRNFLTNMMLMGHITEEGTWKNFRMFMRAMREIKQGSLFYDQLKALDPAFDLTLVHEVPKGAEILYLTYNPYQLMFKNLANSKALRWFHKAMGHAEAISKYAALRAFLEAKYGKSWASRYTTDDLLEGLTKINEFLVDYRTVPPAIHYLRNTIGLFPFITFNYTIVSSFLRNPAALGIEGMRTVRITDTVSRILEGLGFDKIEEKEQALLMDYQKKNPLVFAFKTPDGRLLTIDFTFMLPMGVFAPALSAVEAQGLGGRLLSFVGDVGQQMGSVLRPIIEVAVNQNFLTGMPIYNEYDPPEMKAQKVGLYLANISPIYRQATEALSEAGLVPPTILSIPAKTKAPVVEGDGFLHKTANFMLRVMGMRGFAFQEVQVQQLKRLQAEYKDTVAAMKRIIKHPTMSMEQKTHYFQQYAKSLEEKRKKIQEAFSAYIVVPAYRGQWEPLNHELILNHEGDEEIPNMDYQPPVFEPYGYTPNPPVEEEDF